MMLRQSLFGFLVLALSFTFLGCDPLGDNDEPSVVPSGIYVANAGAHNQSNSSLTIFEPSTGRIQTLPVDQTGFASYIQSLEVASSEVYVLFGETNSVGVFDAESNDQIGQISDVRNPRYMTTDQNTGYVTGQDYSDSPSPKLYEIDRLSYEVTDSVEVGGSPEGVATAENQIFVALGGQNGSLGVVDPETMDLTDTVAVECDEPRSLAVDQQDELLVFCSGSTIYDENFNVVDRTDGAIRVLDPATTSITERIPLDTMLTSASEGQQVFYSSQSDEAFAVLAGGSVLRFDASTNEIADQFSVAGPPIGAIGYHASQERLYLGRVDSSNPYGAQGVVTAHHPDGGQVGSFSAGIAPTHIDIRPIEE